MDFDLRAVYEAVDDRRRRSALSWAEAVREISRVERGQRGMAVSTIRGLEFRPAVEGDGVLQVLLWLDRTPESFIPGFDRPDDARFRLPAPGSGEILRWNARAIYTALCARRDERGVTWSTVAAAIPGSTAASLATLSRGGRVGLPGIMRVVRWLDEPAARFTHLVPRR